MPRRPARRPRRRPARRPRRRMGRALTVVDRALAPFAQRYITKMKYATTITTDAGGQYIFNLNGLNDPDRTGVGHQPYGFDELATIYNRYRVISCGWRVNQATGTAGTPVIISSMPSNDASIIFANMGEMVENPRSKYVTQNVGANAIVLHGKSYIPKLMGRTKTQYMADDNYAALVTANPSELGLLYIQTFNGLSGNQFSGIGLHVVLEFTVEWFDVKHLVQS